MAAFFVSGPSDALWPRTSTEQFMTKHSYKTQMAQNLQKMDQAFPFLHSSTAGSRWRDSLVHGMDQLNKAIEDAWKKPALDSDLASGMADHLRSTHNLDALCRLFMDDKIDLRRESGKTIENYFSERNRDYILEQPWFNGRCQPLVGDPALIDPVSEFLTVLLFDDTESKQLPKDRERLRQSAFLLESFSRQGADACRKIIDAGGLDFLLRACRSEWENGVGEDKWETLRDCASALCNLAVLGGRDVRKAMIDRNVPAWMFVLVSHKDIRIRFYACLIVSAIASERDFEPIVDHSETLPLVMTFLQNHQPADVAPLDAKYRCVWLELLTMGPMCFQKATMIVFRSRRSKFFLTAIVPLLRSPRLEVQAVACFQLSKEAHIRRCRQNGIQVAAT